MYDISIEWMGSFVSCYRIKHISKYKCTFCKKGDLDHIFLIQSRGKHNNQKICIDCILNKVYFNKCSCIRSSSSKKQK